MTKNQMTSEAARRIQSNADKSGKNQGFKSRAMSAADRRGGGSSNGGRGGRKK